MSPRGNAIRNNEVAKKPTYNLKRHLTGSNSQEMLFSNLNWILKQPISKKKSWEK